MTQPYLPRNARLESVLTIHREGSLSAVERLIAEVLPSAEHDWIENPQVETELALWYRLAEHLGAFRQAEPSSRDVQCYRQNVATYLTYQAAVLRSNDPDDLQQLYRLALAVPL